MISLLSQFFRFLGIFARILERQTVRRVQQEISRNRRKADAFDKLSKAIIARRNARNRIVTPDSLPDDKYKRRE